MPWALISAQNADCQPATTVTPRFPITPTVYDAAEAVSVGAGFGSRLASAASTTGSVAAVSGGENGGTPPG
jgi:hypothetical protein